MASSTRKRLGDLLLEAGIITEAQLMHALENKSDNEKLGDFLIKENVLTEQQLIEALAIQCITLMHTTMSSTLFIIWHGWLSLKMDSILR